MALKYTANFKPGDNFPSGAANEIITNVNQNIIDIENLESKIGKKIELNNILTCDVLNSYVTSGTGRFSVGNLYVLTEGGNLITSSLVQPGNYPTKRVFDNAIVVVNEIGANDDNTKVSFEVLHKGVDLTKSTLYMGEITISDLNTFIENTEVLTKDFKYMYKLSDSGQLTSLYNYTSKTKTTEWFYIDEMVIVNCNNVGICTVDRVENKNSVFYSEDFSYHHPEEIHRAGEMVFISEDRPQFTMYVSENFKDIEGIDCIVTKGTITFYFNDEFFKIPQDTHGEDVCGDLLFATDDEFYIKFNGETFSGTNLWNGAHYKYKPGDRYLQITFDDYNELGKKLSQVTSSTRIDGLSLRLYCRLKCFGATTNTSGWVVYNGYYFEPLSFVTKETINEKILEKETKFENQTISTTTGPNSITLKPNTEIRLVGTARSDTAFVFLPTPSTMKQNGAICSVIIPCDTEKTGTIPTISLYNDVKCFGTNCSNNAFTPVSGKIYEFVFYWNGTYVCCAVNGIDV